MAQISRPFQIVLVAVVLVAFASVLALHAHGSNPSEPVPANVPTPTAAAKAAKDAAARRRADHRFTSGKTQASAHKTATHDAVVQKTVVHNAVAQEAVAHKTVAQGEVEQRAVVRKTVVATHTTAADPDTVIRTHHKVVVTPTSKTATPPHRTAAVSHKVAVTHSTHPRSEPSTRSSFSAPKQHVRPAGQLAVEAELAQGKTVMLVFWNPGSSVDQEVHSQASALVSGSKGTVVMHAALASQVNMFGSITEVVRVYQTPTILIVNRHGVVSTLTGLTEVFALRQAVREAQHASG
jgi:hypothetical protein